MSYHIGLETYSTRELLKMLKQARAFHPNPMFLSVPGHGPYVTIDRLKRELATRPHIPNKQESREIRQKVAKEKKSR